MRGGLHGAPRTLAHRAPGPAPSRACRYDRDPLPPGTTGTNVSRTRSFTFLFTDIEGSTQLLSRLGADRYATLLADHHRIVRDALSRHAGTERDTQGDAFFATFESPSACVNAAVAVQRSMGDHPWPAGEAVRVRMGIHVGEASETVTGLVGEDVHRAARIAGVAHGGQVVLSESAAIVVRDGLSPGTTLLNLGQHRLKDLGRPEVLFQVVADGLPARFPPLRSLDNPELPNNLPYRTSTFVGRRTELAEVADLVEAHRLVTLAGAGGSGKTRLALEVAARLLDANREGVFFVDLASVGAPEEVAGAVHSALGLHVEVGAAGLDALLDALEKQQTLIVLDNCEHVVDECARIAGRIQERSKAVHVLATSREPFGIDGERVYRLGPLSLPPEDASSLADLAGSDAVALFFERVRAYDADFTPSASEAALLASVCRRLDGVPFALELAAARLRSMSLVDLHRRLDQRFGLLTSGSRTALPRQRTLQATVDWSYDLLTATEQAVLDRLSVFVGSFDLAAAEDVCASGGTADSLETADALASLVDKSLVASERSSGDLRYRMLETIRQYAADKLAAGGGAAVAMARDRHASHYLALAEHAAPALRGGPDQGRWMRRVDLEWPNLRAAADHCDGTGDGESVIRLGAALRRWCNSRGNEELVPHLLRALRRTSGVDPARRAHGFLAASWILGSGTPSDATLQAAIELVDAGIEAAQGVDDPRLSAELLVLRFAYARVSRDADVDVRSEAARAAAMACGDPGLIGLWLMNEHSSARSEGRSLGDEPPPAPPAPPTVPAAPTARALEALRYLEESGDLQAVAAQYSRLSHDRLVGGDVAGALRYAREAVRVNDEIGGRLDFTGNLAVCALLHGDLEEAERAARSSLVAIYRQGSAAGSINFSMWVIACCATRRGEAVRAARLTGAHDALDAHATEVSSHSFDWTPPEREARRDNRRRLQELLSHQELEDAYTEGRAMPVEAVVDLALGRTH